MSNIALSTEQLHLLHPIQRDLFLGLVLENTGRDKATRKIARCCLDFLNGNVAGYVQHVTSDENMKQVAARMNVAEALSILRAKKRNKKGGKHPKKQKEKKLRRRNYDEEKKKQAAVPIDGNDITMGKGIQHDFEDMANVPNFFGVF